MSDVEAAEEAALAGTAPTEDRDQDVKPFVHKCDTCHYLEYQICFCDWQHWPALRIMPEASNTVSRASLHAHALY